MASLGVKVESLSIGGVFLVNDGEWLYDLVLDNTIGCCEFELKERKPKRTRNRQWKKNRKKRFNRFVEMCRND